MEVYVRRIARSGTYRCFFGRNYRIADKVEGGAAVVEIDEVRYAKS